MTHRTSIRQRTTSSLGARRTSQSTRRLTAPVRRRCFRTRTTTALEGRRPWPRRRPCSGTELPLRQPPERRVLRLRRHRHPAPLPKRESADVTIRHPTAQSVSSSHSAGGARPVLQATPLHRPQGSGPRPPTPTILHPATQGRRWHPWSRRHRHDTCRRRLRLRCRHQNRQCLITCTARPGLPTSACQCRITRRRHSTSQ